MLLVLDDQGDGRHYREVEGGPDDEYAETLGRTSQTPDPAHKTTGETLTDPTKVWVLLAALVYPYNINILKQTVRHGGSGARDVPVQLN